MEITSSSIATIEVKAPGARGWGLGVGGWGCGCGLEAKGEEEEAVMNNKATPPLVPQAAGAAARGTFCT